MRDCANTTQSNPFIKSNTDCTNELKVKDYVLFLFFFLQAKFNTVLQLGTLLGTLVSSELKHTYCRVNTLLSYAKERSHI